MNNIKNILKKTIMTTKEELLHKLMKNGMNEQHANIVIKKAIPIIDKNLSELNCIITWNRPAKEYDKVIHDRLFIQIKPIVYEWYEQNLPDAWSKLIFKS